PICTYKELVGHRQTITLTKMKPVELRRCSCGIEGCRKRKGHTKTIWMEEREVSLQKEIAAEYPLDDISQPSHPLFPRLVDYAIEDAVAALQCAEVVEGTPDPAPWPYGGIRPPFSQAVEESVIAMEAAGIAVDRDWAAGKVKEADAMEAAELLW